MAPAIAAISRPPKAARTAKGSREVSRATPAPTAVALRARPASSTPVPRPTQSSATPPKSAQDMAAAEVVLPMPISPGTKRSALGSTASQPTSSAARRSASLIASLWVKSAVGRSRSMALTVIVAPKVLASWLIAAPPWVKLATICTVTSGGKAETPCATTPWLPAKIAICGAWMRGVSVPCQPASQIATSSRRPKAPGGLVNCPLRATAPWVEASSALGKFAKRVRISERVAGLWVNLASCAGGKGYP